MTPNEVAQAILNEWGAKGMIVRGGFEAMKTAVLSPDAPTSQVDAMRFAYMAGAEHLFMSIMGILDPGSEPTDKDMKTMDLIHKELMTWREEAKLRMVKPGGNA